MRDFSGERSVFACTATGYQKGDFIPKSAADATENDIRECLYVYL